MALALPDDRRQDKDALVEISLVNGLRNLFLGIFHHLFATCVAISISSTCKEQSQIVVDFRNRANRRTRVLVGGLLLDADNRRQARNLVYIRALHVAQEVAGVGRECFYVSALSFGKDSVESQRRFA